MANRTVLQVDQTTLKNQTLLWHLAQQRQDSNLDGRGCLRAHCHHQEKTRLETKPLHNFTNSQRYAFRKSADSKLSREYDTLLDRVGKTSLGDIKQYFSQSNLIEDIRNHYGFHYSSDELRQRLPTLKDTDDLSIYLGPSYGNSFYYFSDVLVGQAMLTKVTGAAPQQAMDALFAEPIKVIKWFLDLSYSCFAVAIKKYLPTLTGKVFEITGARLQDIQMPFFLEPEVNNKG